MPTGAGNLRVVTMLLHRDRTPAPCWTWRVCEDLVTVSSLATCSYWRFQAALRSGETGAVGVVAAFICGRCRRTRGATVSRCQQRVVVGRSGEKFAQNILQLSPSHHHTPADLVS
jgi:hypothetical protein